MNNKVFIECIEDKFSWLLEAGFAFRSIDTSIYFEKNKEGVDDCINFFWAEYNEIKIQGLFALKRFNLVEKLIEQSTGNLDYTIRKPLSIDNINSSLKKPNGEIYISDVDDVKKFSELVQKLFYTSALPFYEEFSSLKNVGNWINENKISDHSKILVVSNNSMMLRKLIILKEINSKDFPNLYQRYKQYLIEKNASKERVYQEMYTYFSNLIEYFESRLT